LQHHDLVDQLQRNNPKVEGTHSPYRFYSNMKSMKDSIEMPFNPFVDLRIPHCCMDTNVRGDASQNDVDNTVGTKNKV
jgi:hypothetical protein